MTLRTLLAFTVGFLVALLLSTAVTPAAAQPAQRTFATLADGTPIALQATSGGALKVQSQ